MLINSPLPARSAGRLVAAAILSSMSAAAHASPVATHIADGAYLSAQRVPLAGKLVAARRVEDQDGVHMLVLSRQAGPSPSAPESGRVERIALLAAFYRETGPRQWRQEWTIRDGSDCPGLDVAGDFFRQAVHVTDLNEDGRAEGTVAYHLFCGGGIDPHVVKVILREGATKLAIRGESRVQYAGQPAFGGARELDRALLQERYSEYKRHLERVWEQVVVDRR